MPPDSLTGRVFDAGALRHVASAQSIYARVLARRAVRHGITFAVPAVAAQLLQNELPRVAGRALQMSIYVVEELSHPDSLTAGDVMRQLGREDPGAEDAHGMCAAAFAAAAHAVVIARRRSWAIITTEPGIYRDVEGVEVEELP